MAIIHVNPYEGFTRTRLMTGSAGYGNYPIDPNYSSARGYVLPVWDQALQPYPTSFNHLNYDLMHTRSIPSYKDVVGAGATTDYHRVRTYLSPTGSPYIYDSGDIHGEIKPFKYYFSWNQGDYGHYNNIKLAQGTSRSMSGRSNTISRKDYAYSWSYGEDYRGFIQLSPHWMFGYSLVNNGELTFASMPHAFSDSSGTPGTGSTTTTTPQGFGAIKAMKVWSPYLHTDPDEYNEMVRAVGYHTTALTEGNINYHIPWDGSFETQVLDIIGYTAQYTLFGPHEGLGNGEVYRGYDSHSLYKRDLATAGSATTTPEFTGIGSTAWQVGYTLPGTQSAAGITTGVTAWSHDASGNAGSTLGYDIDYSDGFLIAGAPGFDGNNGAITSRKNRGGIAVYSTHPQGRSTGSVEVNHTTNAFFAYSRREGEQPGDRFGQAVAVGHNRFIVGAPGFDGGKGKAYLYTDAWRDHEAGPEHETNPDNDPTLHFLTTNYSRPNTSTRAGLSNVSQTTGGSYCKHGHRLYGLKLIKEITPATGVGASFGYAVSIGNGRIAISNLEGAGSVEVFNLEGNRIGILTAPDGQVGDCFGRSVDIEQGVIAVGAPHAVVGIATTTSSYAKQNVRCGAVYLFDRNRVSSVHQRWRGGHHDPQGNEIAPCFLWKQHPPDGANGDRFGDSICVGSGRVLVGAPFKSHFDTPSADGSAYCYNLHGGLLNNITAASYKERQQNINSYAGWGNRGPGIRTDSHFGHAVSINGHYAVISAPFHAEYIEYTGVPDSLFFYYTPQCLTVWDAIDSYNGRI